MNEQIGNANTEGYASMKEHLESLRAFIVVDRAFNQKLARIQEHQLAFASTKRYLEIVTERETWLSALDQAIARESEVQRLRDLVRYQRHALHEAGLISDEEFGALVATSGAVQRLASYDECRAALEAAIAELRAALKKTIREPLTGEQYFDLMEKTAARVDGWPDWKKGDKSCATASGALSADLTSEVNPVSESARVAEVAQLRAALEAALPQIWRCANSDCYDRGHADCAYGLARAALAKGKA